MGKTAAHGRKSRPMKAQLKPAMKSKKGGSKPMKVQPEIASESESEANSTPPMKTAVVAVEDSQSDDEGDGNKFKCHAPPTLAVWLQKHKKGKDAPWGASEAQACLDWVKKLKRHGHDEMSKQLDQSKGDARKLLCTKLFLVKNESELQVIEEEGGKKRDRLKRQEGYMNQFMIWKLKGVPLTPDTEVWRNNYLSKLEANGLKIDDEESPDGHAYWYVHDSAQESVIDRTKSFKLKAKNDKLSVADFKSSVQALDDDYNKNRKKMKSIEPDKSFGKSGADAKKKSKKSSLTIEELDLSKDEHHLASLIQRKSVWEKRGDNLLTAMGKSIDDNPNVDKLISKNKKKVGSHLDPLPNSYNTSVCVSIDALHSSYYIFDDRAFFVS